MILCSFLLCVQVTAMLLTFCGRALLVSALSFTSTSTIICFPLSLLSFASCFSLLQTLPLPHSFLLPPSSISLIHTLLPSHSSPIPILSFSRPTPQGSYGSSKTWKVLEFYYGIFQDWKDLEKDHWSWKVLEIC